MNTNQVRIIGGAWRSRRIGFPDGRGLRPTPDRVRETLFNWLGQDMTGTICLDLFAGSGALGFEAASRGARRVVMVEHERLALAALSQSRAALNATQVEVVKADALEFLRTDGAAYDVVFLDPPFADNHWQTLFERLAARLAPGARVYCEWGNMNEKGEPLAAPPGFALLRQARAGQVNYQLLQLLQLTQRINEQAERT